MHYIGLASDTYMLRYMPRMPTNSRQNDDNLLPVIIKCIKGDDTTTLTEDYVIKKESAMSGSYGTATKISVTNRRTIENRTMVVKEYNTRNFNKQAVEKEQKIAEQLGTHPNIPQIYYWTDTLLVMEAVEGARWLNADKRNYIDKIKLSHQLVNAVHFIHDQGYFHGDLKPDNILVDNKKKLFVIDFGQTSSLETTNVDKITSCHELTPDNYEESSNLQKEAFTVGMNMFLLKHRPSTQQYKNSIYDTFHQYLHPDKKEMQTITRRDIHSKLVELDKDALDAIIAGLIDPDPQTRITLSDALTKLNEVMVTMPK